jgi:hypothetical protein
MAADLWQWLCLPVTAHEVCLLLRKDGQKCPSYIHLRRIQISFASMGRFAYINVR